MRSLRFLTWLDVRREILKEVVNRDDFPRENVSISCFSSAIEVNLYGDARAREESRQKVREILSEVFQDWYQADLEQVRLDLEDAVLPIDFNQYDAPIGDNVEYVHPYWREVVYSNAVTRKAALPTESLTDPKLIAFHSFKGGVGRTLHLAAYLFALLETSAEMAEDISVLVIDADLEAPGLTYWDRKEKQEPLVSFIDFLEAYHYSPGDREETIKVLADEIKKTPRHIGKSKFYFLPACLNDEQLLDVFVLPEHLARSLEGRWTCSDAIHQLGKALSVDYVLIDLRAGLSEISSPIIFDSRIQRFLVTTATEQSVAGTSLVLTQINYLAPSQLDIAQSKLYDPTVIISFLTPELKQTGVFENTLEKLNSAYESEDDTGEENPYSTRLEVRETPFSQELLYINSWEETRSRLAPTSVMEVARNWAETEIRDFSHATQAVSVESFSGDQDKLSEVKHFLEICQQYEFAENGGGEDLLITESFKNLAAQFSTTFPNVIVIGAKGSGKTFAYIQLARLKIWENFLRKVTSEQVGSDQETYLFPFLASITLGDVARDIIYNARANVIDLLSDASKDNFPFQNIKDIEDAVKGFISEDHTELEWVKFWISLLSRSVGFDQSLDSASLIQLSNYLKDRKIRLIFLFDGLEDIFPDVVTNSQEQSAIRALVDIPKRLNDIRQPSFGLVILLRRDLLKYSVKQNFAQHENLYKAYVLSWDAHSFLQLVYWVCCQANVINAREEEVYTLNREEIKYKLNALWGKKLGRDSSKEAYTPNWIYAALSDFNGRLQARDVIRFLLHAAKYVNENRELAQFDRWSGDRLLPPQAIKKAIEPCSDKKIEEVEKEYPEFKQWKETLNANRNNARRIVPFTLEELPITASVVKVLEEIGVIYEDRSKDDIPRYYVPEIYRLGLGFTFDRAARPRVLALKRRAIGRDTL